MEGDKKVLRSVLSMTVCFLLKFSMCLSDSDEFPTYLKTVVEVNASRQLISGPNGYCIGVSDNNYNNGTAIVLLSCDSSAANQLWTFQSDGTLQSNGKCLTANGLTQRSSIVIRNCNTASKDAALWKLQSDGEIVNPKSGFVLTALFGELKTQLTLQKSISSCFQTWRVGNNPKPRLVTIVGMNGLCLQLSSIGITVAQCESNNVGQGWLLYPDATIRPQQNTNHCLGYDNLPNNQIVSFTCGLGPSSQRWLFTNDGAILNERVNMVFDVARSDTSLNKIIVYQATGKPNQKWELRTV